MSEEKNAEKKEKKQETSPAQKARAKEKEKAEWTEQRCHRTARRFSTVEEWMKGAPSCYKAALARGFVQSCCAQMRKQQPQTKVKGAA